MLLREVDNYTQKMKIAVLLTCHNRRAKTEKCLQSLKTALCFYKGGVEDGLCIEIFLTDDGCTDGTDESAREVFPNPEQLHIIHGNGNLFWAGGMRLCWLEALKRHNEWDYYLLLNDDVLLLENVFAELFNAEQFALKKCGKEGLVSGITCAKDDPTKLTYGGEVWVNRFFAKTRRLKPNGEPQLCDLTNANILLVPSHIVSHIGIFYGGYQHGQADYDYSSLTRKAGYPVVLTAKFCGYCDRDHLETKEIEDRVKAMSLSERKAYFKNPIHSNRDYLRFYYRTSPIRVPIVWLGRSLNVYFPRFYYYVSSIRRRL